MLFVLKAIIYMVMVLMSLSSVQAVQITYAADFNNSSYRVGSPVGREITMPLKYHLICILMV